MPTHCMLDFPFLKGFWLVHFVPSFLHPHNHTSRFHLALKTSFALLGGRFRSSVMACKQIWCISTFLLSVRATQMREIWCIQLFWNLLPMAGWKPFQAVPIVNIMSLSRSHQRLFLLYNEKTVIFIHNFKQCLLWSLLHFFSCFVLFIKLVCENMFQNLGSPGIR